MLTFLELCQKYQLNIGSQSPTTITTVASTSREVQRAAEDVNQAWIEIQQYRRDWAWMYKDFSFATTALKQTYTPAIDIGLLDFARWKNDSFRIYLTSAGKGTERFLIHYHDYDQFRDLYLFNTRETTYSSPIAIAIGPDKSLILGLPPDGIYTVRGKYYRRASRMSLDADTPDFPNEDYEMMPVYKALMNYGIKMGAPEVYANSKDLYRAQLSRLIRDSTPEIRF